MRSKRTGGLVGKLFWACLPVSLVLGLFGALWTANEYSHRQDKLARLVAEMPKFDTDAQAKLICENRGLPYPPPAPGTTVREALAKAEAAAHAELESKYPLKSLSEAAADLIKRYSPATVGALVSFRQEDGGGRDIAGVYMGSFEDADGVRRLVVNSDSYPFHEVAVEFRHLFDPALGRRIVESRVRELRSGLMEVRSEARGRVLGQLMRQSGYFANDSAEWMPGERLLAAEMRAAAAGHDRQIRSKVELWRGENAVFGFIPVALPRGVVESVSALASVERKFSRSGLGDSSQSDQRLSSVATLPLASN